MGDTAVDCDGDEPRNRGAGNSSDADKSGGDSSEAGNSSEACFAAAQATCCLFSFCFIIFCSFSVLLLVDVVVDRTGGNSHKKSNMSF